MKKRLVISLLMCFMIFGITGCGRAMGMTEAEADKNAAEKQESATEEITDISEESMEIMDEEPSETEEYDTDKADPDSICRMEALPVTIELDNGSDAYCMGKIPIFSDVENADVFNEVVKERYSSIVSHYSKAIEAREAQGAKIMSYQVDMSIDGLSYVDENYISFLVEATEYLDDSRPVYVYAPCIIDRKSGERVQAQDIVNNSKTDIRAKVYDAFSKLVENRPSDYDQSFLKELKYATLSEIAAYISEDGLSFIYGNYSSDSGISRAPIALIPFGEFDFKEKLTENVASKSVISDSEESGAAKSGTEETPDILNYADSMKLYQDYINAHSDIEENNVDYIYLDDNDSPEMVTWSGVAHADGVSIYTIRKGEVYYLGDYGQYGTMQYKEREGTVIDDYDSESSYMVDVYMLKNGEMRKTHELFKPLGIDKAEGTVDDEMVSDDVLSKTIQQWQKGTKIVGGLD